MTTTTSITTIHFTQETLFQNIITECRKYSISKTSGTRHMASDLEGDLIEKVYTYIKDRPQYHNIRGLRQIIKSRGKNFFNMQSKINSTYPVSYFEFQRFNDKSTTPRPLEVTDLETYIEEKNNVSELLESLSTRQRLIIELTAGIMDSLTSDQLVIATRIIESKTRCKKGHIGQACSCEFELFFSIPDIATIISCSSRTVDNELKRIREGA